MRPIYKSVVLESAILAVSLSLQAEINDGSDITTVGVDASTLDGLRVELASPKVSGALDLIASGAAVVSGSTISVTLGGFEELATLEQVTYRLTVKARYGTQVRTLYALDITVPRGTLAGGTQEYEDSFAVVSTFGDGGGEFPDDYARQGDDPDATNTAILEEVKKISAVDADIYAGKQALATNISTKGIPATVADALTTMATKVLQIPQAVNTGISEFEQTIAPTPYMWNVYTVARDLMKRILPAYIPSYMSGGNYEQYRANNAFFVGEYYLGYDTLELTGADGYLTCDGDFYIITGEAGSRIVEHTLPDGTVETYTAETIIHTWHDEESDYCNRWVGFFYLTGAYSFTNTSSNICPRRAAICGVCDNFIISDANRLTDVWVIGELNNLQGGTTGSSWSPAQVIRNLKGHTGGVIYNSGSMISIILPELENSASGNITSGAVGSLITLSLPRLRSITGGIAFTNSTTNTALKYVNLDSLDAIQDCIVFQNFQLTSQITSHISSMARATFFRWATHTPTGITSIIFDRLASIDTNSSAVLVTDERASVQSAFFPALEVLPQSSYLYSYGFCNAIECYLPAIKSGVYKNGGPASYSNTQTTYILLGCMGEKSQTVRIVDSSDTSHMRVTDVEIGDKENIDNGDAPRWNPCQNLDVSSQVLLTEANMYAHILQRLKQDETDCGDGVTITLGATNLAKLTSQESVDLLDSLTNTYGYTFA